MEGEFETLRNGLNGLREKIEGLKASKAKLDYREGFERLIKKFEDIQVLHYTSETFHQYSAIRMGQLEDQLRQIERDMNAQGGESGTMYEEAPALPEKTHLREHFAASAEWLSNYWTYLNSKCNMFPEKYGQFKDGLMMRRMEAQQRITVQAMEYADDEVRGGCVLLKRKMNCLERQIECTETC